MKAKDPIIRVDAALMLVGGAQKDLAKLLGVSKARMSQIVATYHELPFLHAHRLVSAYGDGIVDRWVDV